MFFYFFFIVTLILLFANYNINSIPKPRIVTIFGIIFFTSILIFRFDVGYDYQSYYNLFVPTLQINLIQRLEPISQFICYIVDYFNFPHLFFIIFGLLTSYFVFDTILKYSNNYLLSILLYVTLFFDSITCFIREGLAAAIILYSYRYIVGEKWMKYTILCIIAGLIHYSAFICLIFPILYKILNSPWKLISAIILSTFFSYGLLLLISTQLELYETYVNGDVEITGGRLLRYVHLVILIYSYILTYRHPNNKKNRRFVSIGLLGMVFPFVLGGHFGGRISMLFIIYECIVLPNLLSQHKRQIRLLWTTALSLLFLMIIYVSTGNPTKSPYTPYKTIFSVDLKHPKFKI